MPSILLYNFEAAIFRSVGITRMPLQALAVSTVLNIGLDLIFVPVLHWGVAGVAIATAIAYTVRHQQPGHRGHGGIERRHELGVRMLQPAQQL